LYINRGIDTTMTRVDHDSQRLPAPYGNMIDPGTYRSECKQADKKQRQAKCRYFSHMASCLVQVPGPCDHHNTAFEVMPGEWMSDTGLALLNGMNQQQLCIFQAIALRYRELIGKKFMDCPQLFFDKVVERIEPAKAAKQFHEKNIRTVVLLHVI